MNRMTTAIAGVLAIVMIAVAVPAAAQTDTEASASQERIEHGIERLRERVIDALDRRLERIDRLQEAIDESETVEPQNAAHLTADLSASHGLLTSLEARATSAKTVEELGAVVDEMVHEHRIFALRSPQTRLVLASDFGVVVADRLDGVATSLAEAATRADDAGFDVAEVDALIREAQEQTAAGLALVDPVAETVLPLEPIEYPDPARSVLEEGRAGLVDGRQAYRNARDSLREAARLLADIVGSVAG